jgi:hypothetical protein
MWLARIATVFSLVCGIAAFALILVTSLLISSGYHFVPSYGSTYTPSYGSTYTPANGSTYTPRGSTVVSVSYTYTPDYEAYANALGLDEETTKAAVGSLRRLSYQDLRMVQAGLLPCHDCQADLTMDQVQSLAAVAIDIQASEYQAARDKSTGDANLWTIIATWISALSAMVSAAGAAMVWRRVPSSASAPTSTLTPRRT